MTENIYFTISCQARKFQEKSIVIPYEMKTLYLDIRMPEECRYMGYILLKDETGDIRLHKLLGYGEQKLAVGEDGAHTTIGGVPGNISPGTWTLGFIIFTEYIKQRLGDTAAEILTVMTDEAQEITEPMGEWCWTGGRGLAISPEKYDWSNKYQSGRAWYKGDFHTHTRLSDGKETVAHAMEKAEDMDMDFYIPTEHNLMHTGWCDTNLCIVPGIEITTDKGHFNLFGITKLPEKFFDIVSGNGDLMLERDVALVMEEAEKSGWITSLNHPFLTIWQWQYGKTSLKDFQCVEIINDPTYQDAAPSNDKAIRFLDTLWEDGHKICGIGGSDSHNLIDERYVGSEEPSVPGDPGTYVLCDGLSPESLMENVRKGHVCVTRFCRVIPKITVDDREYFPGDEISTEGRLTYEAEIHDLSEKPTVYLIKNGQKLEAGVREAQEGMYSVKELVSMDGRDWNWVRLEIRKQNGDFLGFVNPVYRGRRESVCKTVEDIWKQMGEH